MFTWCQLILLKLEAQGLQKLHCIEQEMHKLDILIVFEELSTLQWTRLALLSSRGSDCFQLRSLMR